MTNIQAFLAMISKSEGTSTSPVTVNDGYDIIVSGVDGTHSFDDYADHPFAHGRPPIVVNHAGLKSTASGRYQIIVGTWREVAAKLGLADFSPESQDAAATELVRRRGALDAVNSGDIATAINLCREEWASLPGGSSGQPEARLDELVGWYQEAVQA